MSAACRSHAECAAGEWCGTPGGAEPNRCVAVDRSAGQADPAWCTCAYAGTWDCPAGTEWGNVTCCRPAPRAWGAQTYATGCPRADQWCGRDPTQPDVGFGGQHCQIITADQPCLPSESAVDTSQVPIPCPDWPATEPEPARPRASAAAAVAPSTAFVFATTAAVVTLANVGGCY